MTVSEFSFGLIPAKADAPESGASGPRAGLFRTPHGSVLTPAFMPVATQASVKGLSPEEVRAVGADIVLSNAYHLYLRPGVSTVNNMGGVQEFMGWNGPVLTDSGGFQAFSMGALRKICDDGINFRSHIDGSAHFLSPKLATQNQLDLGTDILMCLDQCISYGARRDEVVAAMERTHRWAEMCHQHHAASGLAKQQALFGIVQGGTFEDLREASTRFIADIPFQGYAIGGLAVGESKDQMYRTTKQVASRLPQHKPRYLMGVGSPEDLVECVARGIDMFDCVLPTRVGRNGAIFTKSGRIDITKARFLEQREPVEQDCDCYACRSYSAAYVCHLFRAKELLGARLASIHNLRFILRLMANMREAILQGMFKEFRREFHENYVPTSEAARQEQKEKWLKAMGA